MRVSYIVPSGTPFMFVSGVIQDIVEAYGLPPDCEIAIEFNREFTTFVVDTEAQGT